ncbi:MAG: Glycosyl transferase family 2 [Candidatus Woesebacteria bacterium GW2011_GWC1_38_13]|uniref:Glycosyl transferase family 2 n=3 Tax=Candidatus Woeseibacteriota TaxID=1752722 RepID=A0A0G0P0V9_9BACT|nr:MAG: Glycosyl transferase family 2 [Candidatus Woesebacteria bacterium GW2011_GWD1_38_10]KKQ56812.1 MAG: Glycosyl transferase family 2 [Candidatus Woesebacteria bacterium GW2011_GWC1_38_13]KKQ82956.1 MAG: Glycosyl transferase family 2 [Candidatus Woesebacteria bacterium GW2011_GWA1_38_8]
MKSPLVSIIISNLNGHRLNLLEDCLNSLTKPNYSNWELLVIDNNSDDDSVSYLTTRFNKLPNCRVVRNKINMYSQGLNLGANNARGKYLCYFNNDVAIHKDYFENIIKRLKYDKNIAILQGKLLNYYKRNIIDTAGETMDIYGNPVTIGAGEKDRGQFDKEEEILSASGSACVIKKDVFVKIGGYDPEYGIGYEDMDLALRARSMGYKVIRYPNAIVYHKRASTDLAPFVRLKVKQHFNKNRIATMIKNYPLTLLLRSLPVTILLYKFIGTWEWIVNRNWNIGLTRFTSIGWVIINLGQITSKRKRVKNITKKNFQFPINLFSQKSLNSIFKDFIDFNKRG